MRCIIAFILVFICSCKNYDYDIEDMRSEQVSFAKLPLTLKKYLSMVPPCDPKIGMYLCVNVSDSSRFFTEPEPTIIGPWISYEKLIDKKNNIIYKIATGTPSPYIIFRNKVYIPNEYNIFCGEDFREAMYTVYQLKQE